MSLLEATGEIDAHLEAQMGRRVPLFRWITNRFETPEDSPRRHGIYPTALRSGHELRSLVSQLQAGLAIDLYPSHHQGYICTPHGNAHERHLAARKRKKEGAVATG